MNRATDKFCSCFLLRKLTRRVTQTYDRCVAPAGLSITQYSLRRHLQRQAGLSVSRLAAGMGMERTTEAYRKSRGNTVAIGE